MVVLPSLYLRNLRKRRKYTLQQVSAGTGIGEAYLSRLENGRRTIGPKAAMLLATFFDVPVEKFWTPRRTQQVKRALRKIDWSGTV